MKQAETSHKSSFVGITAIIVSIITIFAAVIYYYLNISVIGNPAQGQQFSTVLENFSVIITSFLIVFYGNLLSLFLAVISLVRKERKLFALIAGIWALFSTIIAGLLINTSAI